MSVLHVYVYLAEVYLQLYNTRQFIMNAL